jgi:hypothetical protein
MLCLRYFATPLREQAGHQRLPNNFFFLAIRDDFTRTASFTICGFQGWSPSRVFRRTLGAMPGLATLRSKR